MRLSTCKQIALLTLALSAPASAGAQGWVSRYNGPANGDDRGAMAAVDAAGATYVVGDSLGTGTGLDILIVKYGRDGGEIWSRRYNGPGNGDDVAWNLALDASGNVYVSGRAVVSAIDTDYVTLKYDPNGAQLWARRYNGPGNREDVPYSLFVDPAGNAYVTGYSYGGVTNWDFATVKYDPAGNPLWAARYADPSEDTALALTVDGAGSVYVAGRSWRGATARSDWRIVKYDSAGSQLWTATYNGPASGDDEAVAVGLDGAGNLYAAGYSTGAGTGTDYTTIKYDPGGNRLWTTRYDGPAHGSDVIAGMAVEPGGAVFVTGSSRVTASVSGFATLKYDPSGAQLWAARRDGAAGLSGGRFVTLDGSGSVFVAGQEYVNGGLDLAVVKYDAGGSEVWLDRYDGPAHGDDYAHSVALDSSGNLFAAGGSAGSGSGRDLLAVKYALGSTPTSILVPDVSGVVGQTVTLSATLSVLGGGGALGMPIRFRVDGSEVPGSPVMTDASGAASISYAIPEGSVGERVLTATFEGSPDHEPSAGTAKLQVGKSETALTVEDVYGDAGEAVTVTLRLKRMDGAPLAGRTVRLEVNGGSAGAGSTDAEGVASIQYTIPAGSLPGDLTAAAFFDGDADYQASTDAGKITVRSPTRLTVFDASSKVGVVVTLRAQLRSAGVAVVGKSVRFLIDGQPTGSATTDAQGFAALAHTVSESAGMHALLAEFDGDALYRPATSESGTLTVNMTQTALSVANVTATPGKVVKLKATLKAGGIGLAGRAVTFSIDGSVVGEAKTDSYGTAHLAYTVVESLGDHVIGAVFAGEGTEYGPAKGAGTLKVNAIPTGLSVAAVNAQPGETVELKARLRAKQEPLPGRKVAFFVGGEFVGEAETDAEGLAVLPYSVTVGPGTYEIRAVYAGDGVKYAPAEGDARLRVRAHTKIVAESLKARAGSKVAYGARLLLLPSGSPMAGRKLQFFAGCKKLGCAATDANGRAIVSVTAPSKGEKLQITVRFEGDGQYRGAEGWGKILGQ